MRAPASADGRLVGLPSPRESRRAGRIDPLTIGPELEPLPFLEQERLFLLMSSYVTCMFGRQEGGVWIFPTSRQSGPYSPRHLKTRWKQKLPAAVYDLTTEDVQFREATWTAWKQLKPEDHCGLF